LFVDATFKQTRVVCADGDRHPGARDGIDTARVVGMSMRQHHQREIRRRNTVLV
jgi:hypothetical protein